MQIELVKPHTHAGDPINCGARLELPETSARWLIERGVAQAVARPAAIQGSAAANPLPPLSTPIPTPGA